MGKGATTNYFGIAVDDLELMGGGDGAAAQSASMPDENGDIAIEEMYAERNNPKNSFSVLSDFDVAAGLVLGTVTDGDALPDKVLTSFDIQTGAGSAPTVDVGGVSIHAPAWGATVTFRVV